MAQDAARALETGTLLGVLVLGLAATGLLLSPTVSDALPLLAPVQATMNLGLYVAHMAMAALLVAFTLWHLFPFVRVFARKPRVRLGVLVASWVLLALVAAEVATGLQLYFHVYAPLGKREAVATHLALTFVLLVPLAVHAWRGLGVWRERRAARTLALDAAERAGRGDEARAAQARLTRRAFLRLTAYAVAGAALAAAFARGTAEEVQRWRLNSVGATPTFPHDSYRLRVTGLVGKPIELTLAQLKALPARTVRITHRCVEGWTYTDTFTGVPLPDVLRLAGGVLPGAKQLLLKSPEVSRQMHALGRKYDVNLPIWDAENDEILIVYAVRGEDLPPEHGHPVRVMSNAKWGYKACKWLTEIHVTPDAEYLGYWERLGYHEVGDYPGPIFAEW